MALPLPCTWHSPYHSPSGAPVTLANSTGCQLILSSSSSLLLVTTLEVQGCLCGWPLPRHLITRRQGWRNGQMGRRWGCQDTSCLPLSPWPVSLPDLMTRQTGLPPGPFPGMPGDRVIANEVRPGSAAATAPPTFLAIHRPRCPFFALWICACDWLSQS